MNDKIELIYEDNEYRVIVNGREVFKDIDAENAFEKFQTEIRYSRSEESKVWEKIVTKLEKINIEGLEINTQFKTLAFGDVKYFHNMQQTSFIKNGVMVPLIGGYKLFKLPAHNILMPNFLRSSKASIRRSYPLIGICLPI